MVLHHPEGRRQHPALCRSARPQQENRCPCQTDHRIAVAYTLNSLEQLANTLWPRNPLPRLHIAGLERRRSRNSPRCCTTGPRTPCFVRPRRHAAAPPPCVLSAQIAIKRVHQCWPHLSCVAWLSPANGRLCRRSKKPARFQPAERGRQVCSARADLQPAMPRGDIVPPANLHPRDCSRIRKPAVPCFRLLSRHLEHTVALCCASSNATTAPLRGATADRSVLPGAAHAPEYERESNHRGFSLSEIPPLRLLKCCNGPVDGTRVLLLESLFLRRQCDGQLFGPLSHVRLRGPRDGVARFPCALVQAR